MGKNRIIVTAVAIATAANSLIPMAGAASVTDYTDYNANAWHAPAVKFVVDNDIMIGTSKTTLTVERNITRAEFVSLIDRLFATYRQTDISQFEDVSQTDWYFDNVAMGVQMGTITGTSDRTVSPKGLLTREMAMTILARALALDTTDTSKLNDFTDEQDISSWARSSVAVLMEQGRVQGYTDNTVRPKQYITRAETAQLLMNCFNALSSEITTSNVSSDGIYLLRPIHDATVQNSTFKDTLILANGLRDSNVALKGTSINRLLCWGSHDVWVYPGCTINEIVISRTDGPCYIHWLGDKSSLPKITIRDKADNESKVVDKDGNQLDSKKDDTTSGGGTSGGGSHASRNVVYFDPCNGGGVSSVTIDENGYAQPIETPQYAGHVFGGWYLDKEGEQRFVFTNKVTVGTTYYAKWYTEDEWRVIEELNHAVTGSTATIKADTDLFATVGASRVPCNIQNAAGNSCDVTVELVLKDSGQVIGRIENMKPGQTATEIPLVEDMPAYGNYQTYLKITPVDGQSGYEIDSMLYVAYAWAK